MTKISTSFRHALAVAAGGALLATVSVPAYAVGNAEPAKGEATPERTSRPSSEKKICLANTVSGADTVTGSIIQKKQCKTKAQWEALGVQFGRK